MRDTRQEIVRFWFEETDPRLWFQQNDEFDFMVRDRFLVTYEMARDGLCASWASDDEGSLALCLLLDQFPRRMFRGQAAAFATDDKALLVAKNAVKKGYDQLMPHERRFFLYIPFEHSENLSDHKRNLELFGAMRDENPIAHDVAKRRFAVIEKFGRYPERNEILGRESMPEELEYLSQIRGQT